MKEDRMEKIARLEAKPDYLKSEMAKRYSVEELTRYDKYDLYAEEWLHFHSIESSDGDWENATRVSLANTMRVLAGIAPKPVNEHGFYVHEVEAADAEVAAERAETRKTWDSLTRNQLVQMPCNIERSDHDDHQPRSPSVRRHVFLRFKDESKEVGVFSQYLGEPEYEVDFGYVVSIEVERSHCRHGRDRRVSDFECRECAADMQMMIHGLVARPVL